MKILFIKQLFNPEPTAKGLDFALELKRRGHEIQVLTGFPSYPLGRIYDGYRQSLWKRETIEGINVIRVPIYPNQSDNGARRILHYLSYAFTASLLGLFLVRKPDVAFVYQGAVPVGIPAILLKWFRRVPFVYDINDLWPESVAVSGMMKNRLLLRLIESWCKFNYQEAGKITVATPGFKENLVNKGIPPSKIEFVPNWSRDVYRKDQLEGELKERFFPKNKFNILYAGNLGVVQGLDVILDAALHFQNKGNTIVHFVLLGAGADEDRLRYKKDKVGLKNLNFIPRVDSSEVTKYLNVADALIVHLKNTPLFEITIPSKILSYLRTGKPILLGVKGNAADIIIESGAGYLFEPEDMCDLVDKIEQLLLTTKEEVHKMGLRGVKYYNEHLSIVSSTDKMERIFEEVIMEK